MEKLMNLGRGLIADGAGALLNPLVGQLAKIVGGNKWGDILVGGLKFIVDKALGWVRGKETDMVKVPAGGGGGGGGAGVQRWSGLVLQVLAMLGQPASLLPKVLRRMQQESGGNPNAYNNWDSNAKKGIPSQGLMQTVPPTFARWAGPFRSRGIMDPLASIYAGLNYAIHQYPSLAYAMDKPGGYLAGGIIPGPTGQGRLALVHGGEMVSTASDVAAARKRGGATTVVKKYYGTFNITCQSVTVDDIKDLFKQMEIMDLETF